MTAEQMTIILTALGDYLERQEEVAHDIEAVLCLADEDEIPLMEFDLSDVQRRCLMVHESISILRSVWPHTFREV